MQRVRQEKFPTGTMFGKKHSPDSIRKMSAAQKERFATGEHPRPFLGKAHTPESKAKIGRTN